MSRSAAELVSAYLILDVPDRDIRIYKELDYHLLHPNEGDMIGLALLSALSIAISWALAYVRSLRRRLTSMQTMEERVKGILVCIERGKFENGDAMSHMQARSCAASLLSEITEGIDWDKR